MKSKNHPILILTSLLICQNVFATIDYLVVNHITKELYWAGTDHKPGFIGWKSVPETKWKVSETKYLESGYSRTSFPFKIELGLFTLLILVGIGVVIIKKRNKN